MTMARRRGRLAVVARRRQDLGRRAVPQYRPPVGIRTGRRSVGKLVDRYGDGEQKRLILTRGDLDPICFTRPDPLPGDRCDHVAVALDLVLVGEDVALGLEILAVFDIDLVAVADSDKRLVHGCQILAVALQLHGAAQVEYAILDVDQLLARVV